MVRVAVGLRGCNTVFNGVIGTLAAGRGTPRADGPELIAEMEKLLGLPPDRWVTRPAARAAR
jgi:hypothetical protein